METKRKRLPIGIQTFERLITENYLYIDKTQTIYQMIQEGAVYFLARPRRFGKSLLVSTFRALFEGKKDLFQGLWIAEKSDYPFEKHPVIHLDMSTIASDSISTFEKSLNLRLETIAKDYGCSINTSISVSDSLTQLIEALKPIGKVVVLIDEYDGPLIRHLENLEMGSAMRETLREFYKVLKTRDSHLQFVFITGISQFSKVSIFSGLNHLRNLSFTEQYGTLLGYTQSELEQYFPDRITELAEKEELSKEQTLQKIKRWYNGYLFAQESVYNPFSTLLLLQEKQYDTYWFQTGTPRFLVDLMKKNNFSFADIENQRLTLDSFNQYELEDLDPLALLFQTGYLTVNKIEKVGEDTYYSLKIPNQEVEKSFYGYLLVNYSSLRRSELQVLNLIDTLKALDFDAYFKHLKIFFAQIPYDLQLDYEKYYQTIFYMIHKVLGFYVSVEVHTNQGRIDSVIETPEAILLFEFKLNATAQTALQQIQDKQYFQKYQDKNKPIFLIGVGFQTQDRNLNDYQVEKITP